MSEERELKLELTEAEADRLQAALGPPQRILHQENTYLDSRDGRLRANGIGLRMRCEREGETARYMLTLKGPTQWSAALAVRSEEELELTAASATAILRGGLDPRESPLASLRAMAADLALPHLLSLGAMTNERTILRLPEEPTILLELDRSRFPDESTACELEVELPPTAEDIVASVRAALTGCGVDWRPQTRGKFSRFLDCLGQS